MPENADHNATVYDIFILLFTILSLVVAIFVFQDGSTTLKANFWRIDLVFSFVFMADFLYRWWHSADKRSYLRHNWGDLLGSLPAVPHLRFFRLFRVWRLVRIFQRSNVHQLWNNIVRRRAESSLWGMIILVIVSVLVAGWWIEGLERAACAAGNPAANICTLEDGFWWAFVTVTTVGYGDLFPVSSSGRIMAAVLMTIGVGLFGILTSYLAAIFVEDEEKERDEVLDGELREIRAELAEIKLLLRQQVENKE
ncbi:MAG: ion transporter [Candidatus Promineifilaceae bacterium]